MSGNTLAAVALLAAAAAACGTGRRGSAGFRLPDGDIAKGKEVFVAQGCHSCHEVDGVRLPAPVADPPVGVRLGGAVDTVPTDGRLATAILFPSHRFAPGPREAVRSGRLSRMGDFTESMTLREMIDVVAFLQSTYRHVPARAGRWPAALAGK